MSWVYQQSTGVLSFAGEPVGTGYSGHGLGLNNPALQTEHNVGPIPQGFWTIGNWDRYQHLGLVVAPLSPSGHDAYGRSGFFIHGDNKYMNKTASDGCIILSLNLRELIKNSNAVELEVVQ